MIPAIDQPNTLDAALAFNRPRAAVYGRPFGTGTLWPVSQAGTGGLEIEAFMRKAFGYRAIPIVERAAVPVTIPSVELMAQVKAGFGRTMSRLPEVFGVSRQTLYNWMQGETPKPVHQERLVQLASAAAFFQEAAVTPTTPMLERTISQGKNFLQLLANGSDGRETARKLVRITQASGQSRAQLDALLGGRKAKLSASDIGAPSLDESV